MSGFVLEPHFSKGLDKRTDGGIVDLLLLLNNGSEDLGTRGIIPEASFDSLLKLKPDGCDHIFSDPSKIVAVEVAYRENFTFPSPNPVVVGVWTHLGALRILMLHSNLGVRLLFLDMYCRHRRVCPFHCLPCRT